MDAPNNTVSLGTDVIGVDSHEFLSVGGSPDHAMDYGTFMATEGGRKCPICGKYAKKVTVGNLSFTADIGGGWAHVSMYGHLPGYGCNISDNAELRDRSGSGAPIHPEPIE